MKKLFLLFFAVCIFSTHLFAAAFSVMSSDGLFTQYLQLNQFIKKEQQKIQDFYAKDIQDILKQIAEQTKKKEKNLKILNALQKEALLDEKQILFLFKQESEILSNRTQIEAVQ